MRLVPICSVSSYYFVASTAFSSSNILSKLDEINFQLENQCKEIFYDSRHHKFAVRVNIDLEKVMNLFEI